MFEKKGQISLEYLIVVGFVVFVVITILGVAIFYASGIRDRIKINQLNNFANKIISNAEVVFFAGEPSKVTITAYLPEGVQYVNVVDDNGIILLVIAIETNSGLSVMAFPSDVPIDTATDISSIEGTKRLEITARANNVEICEFTDC